MSKANVIRMGAERVYQLRPYESVRLTVEVEVPDTRLDDDQTIRSTYLECIQQMDKSFAAIVDYYNNPKY